MSHDSASNDSASNESTRDENRAIAAVVIAGVLSAISVALGVVVWLVKIRIEPVFKELGVMLPGITVLALDPLVHVIALVVLAGSAAMIAIKGLRVIGSCTWVIFLFLYLGFWALSFGFPLLKMTEQLEEKASSSRIEIRSASDQA